MFFSTRVLADYWVFPWGIALFSLMTWAYAAGSGLLVPALAFLDPVAAVILIPFMAFVNVIVMLRMQPRFIAAHRLSALHAEDDLRSPSE